MIVKYTKMEGGAYECRPLIRRYGIFEDGEMWQLRDRVELVHDFDRLADRLVAETLYIAENFTVEEKTVLVPSTRYVLAQV